MNDSLKLSVPRTLATLAWLREQVLMERGEQIAAAFSKYAVEFGGLSSVSGTNAELGTSSFHFEVVDLEQALAEFPEVGRRLNFPPGTRLVHFGPGWMTSQASIRTVTTW